MFARILFLVLLTLAAPLAFCRADDAAPVTSEIHAAAARFNLQLATFGGMQFWTDELVFRGYRIQKNAFTDHYRLLDERDRRLAWGDFQQCRSKLERVKKRKNLAPLQGPVVLALHGIIRTRGSMSGLCDELANGGDYTVMNVSYASTRFTIDEHARAFAKVIEHLGPDVTEINLVAHSMGNLVIRRYIAGCEAGEAGFPTDPRIHRIVMLAPPNQGSQLAVLFRDNVLMEWIWGKSAIQIAEDWPELKLRLATPRCQFAIVAGAEPSGLNRALRGDDDLILRVPETKLVGARDFAVLPVEHGQIMNEPTARQYALRFFQHGHFVSDEARQPIAALEAGEAENAVAADDAPQAQTATELVGGS